MFPCTLLNHWSAKYRVSTTTPSSTLLQESIFSLMEMIVVLFWGGISDRLGRKPVLLFCLIGLALCMAAFGLARTIWSMLALRAVAGVFGGTMV